MMRRVPGVKPPREGAGDMMGVRRTDIMIQARSRGAIRDELTMTREKFQNSFRWALATLKGKRAG
ncbi:hypothetical protein ACFL45_04515 [Candidatus Neomarinimicrobiota bacterium]